MAAYNLILEIESEACENAMLAHSQKNNFKVDETMVSLYVYMRSAHTSAEVHVIHCSGPKQGFSTRRVGGPKLDSSGHDAGHLGQ
jgi:hypothetical protein